MMILQNCNRCINNCTVKCKAINYNALANEYWNGPQSSMRMKSTAPTRLRAPKATDPEARLMILVASLVTFPNGPKGMD